MKKKKETNGKNAGGKKKAARPLDPLPFGWPFKLREEVPLAQVQKELRASLDAMIRFERSSAKTKSGSKIIAPRRRLERATAA